MCPEIWGWQKMPEWNGHKNILCTVSLFICNKECYYLHRSLEEALYIFEKQRECVCCLKKSSLETVVLLAKVFADNKTFRACIYSWQPPSRSETKFFWLTGNSLHNPIIARKMAAIFFLLVTDFKGACPHDLTSSMEIFLNCNVINVGIGLQHSRVDVFKPN